jgi:hypothetical protein
VQSAMPDPQVQIHSKFGSSIADCSKQVGALICFAVVGLDVFFVMQSLGEIATLYPTPGAFTEVGSKRTPGIRTPGIPNSDSL